VPIALPYCAARGRMNGPLGRPGIVRFLPRICPTPLAYNRGKYGVGFHGFFQKACGMPVRSLSCGREVWKL